MYQPNQSVPVLIVGGGISGLSAALFLTQHGIKSLVIEQHQSTSIHPRARGFDVRTMELYRELQLSESIREAGKALAPALGIRTAESVAAFVKNRKPKKKKVDSPIQMPGLEMLAALSPETGARCTQDFSEPLLLEAARLRGADIRFSTQLVSFDQNEEEIVATIKCRQTKKEEIIRASYMIAADGARSHIRETLNMQTVGKGSLGCLLNIYFEADLGDIVKGHEFSIMRIDEPGIKGMLTSINNTDRWVFHLSYDPEKGEEPHQFTHEKLNSILQRVIGFSHIHIRIISVLPWQPTVKAVTEMRNGRIFFAGDAAHIMTPYGGKGANTGVQDAHNIAWKLAFVLLKKAGPKLLESYSSERQPVGQYNSEQSGTWANQYGLIKKVNLKMLSSFLRVILVSKLHLNKLFPNIALKRLGGLLGLPNMQYGMGTGYHMVIALRAQPGTRVPHIWVKHGNQRKSTLDFLGRDFVLFTGADNSSWKKAAAITLMNICIYGVGEKSDLITPEAVEKIFGIGSTGAVLVRPDGFVAAKWPSAPPEPAMDVKAVLSRLLDTDQINC